MGDTLDMEELNRAKESLEKPGSGAPDNIHHPKYGWILIDGEPTESGIKWLEKLRKEGSI